MNIRIEDSTIYEGDKAIGEILADGTPKLARGHHTKRQAIEELLAGRSWEAAGQPEESRETPNGVQGEPATGSVSVPHETKGSLASPPQGSPQAGDKDPDVIAWWFKHRPDEARERYKNRSFAGKERYFPND